MIRKTGAALAIAAGVLGAVALSTSAFAAPNGVANLGEFVVFEDANYLGGVYDTTGDVTNYTLPLTAPPTYFGTTRTVNDSGSSVANYSSSFVRAYVNAIDTGIANGGAYINVYPYQTSSGSQSWAYYNLSSFDNAISSHDFQ
ncbi:peptidase inhibitor family I36 protein [Actinoplanes sp. NPDC026619]|uniref:peptidase inhibitor family I36 protein n=1 Tax=Actinoplanes sp. NPDC026619 TaxID=3155798 RepID=UPI0033EBB968